MGSLQYLPGNGSSRHSSDGFPGRSSPSTAAGLNPILRLISGVGMGGAEGDLHFLVILRTLIFVAHHHGDRCAKGDPIHHTAEDLHLVGFLSGCGDLALPRASPIEFSLNGHQVQFQSWRASFQDHPHAAAMGLAEGADAEQGAETAAHGMPSIAKA